MNRSGPGQLVGLAFVVVVVAAIVALLAGYGVPVGIGALAGFILGGIAGLLGALWVCLLYTSPSPRDRTRSRMPSSA